MSYHATHIPDRAGFPRTKLPCLADTLRDILADTADRLARATGFVQRQRTLTGAVFVQTLVFGWLDDPDAPLSHLADTAAAVGCPIAPQSLDARFTEAAAALLEAVLARAVGALVCGPAVTQGLVAQGLVAQGLVARFDGVALIDSTVVALPATAADRWPGCGGHLPEAGRAALKVETRLDLADGAVAATLMAGRHHDRRGALAAEAVRPGSLRVADLGYFSLDRFAEIGASGAFWLSRLKLGTVLTDAEGDREADRLNLLDAVQPAASAGGLAVYLGAERALPCRLSPDPSRRRSPTAAVGGFGARRRSTAGRRRSSGWRCADGRRW